MFPMIAIDQFVGKSTLSDVRTAISHIRYGRARLVRLPAEDFAAAMDKVLASNLFVPFRPTLSGLPVSPSGTKRPEVVVVYDDDTNARLDAIEKEEFDAKHN